MDVLCILSYASLSILILQYLYKYLKKPFNYWEERGIPSTPAIPILGSLYENFTEELPKVLLRRYKEYGRIFGFHESNRPVISIADPDLLKDILVKDFHIFPNRRDITSGDPLLDNMISVLKDEKWKRVRTILTPAFASGRIKKMALIMKDAAETTLKNFERYADCGEFADCKRLFGTFTMDVIARSAFGMKIDSHNDPENEFVQHARKAFEPGLSLKKILFFINPNILRILRKNVFSSKATDFFTDVALGMIKHRRETGQKQNDFLQLLMDAADEATNDDATLNEELEDENEKTINDLGHDLQNKHVFRPSKKYKGLSQDELVAQCVIFFLAGYDTTASTLSFASYLLALNPECQEKLTQEIDEALKTNENVLTYDAVQNMKYLENVIWETLRLYPPAISIERRAEEDYQLGSTGITIPKGMLVSIPTYAMHRDPEFYENPEKFDPDRFCAAAKDLRNPYTYAPFGAGPRNCVGMRFALTEIKFCLATLLRKFRLKRCPKTQVPLEFFFGQGLLQPKGIILSIEHRKNSIR